MRSALVAALLVLAVVIGAGAAPRATSTAFKGYELYSYRARGQWRFVLVAGTNREKPAAEIARATALTLPALKSRLSRLAEGEYVTMLTAPDGAGIHFEPPDPGTVADLRALADRLRIHLQPQ